MNDVIEKLGIKPIKIWDKDVLPSDILVCIPSDVISVEQLKNDLLISLIESTKDNLNMYINHYGASKTTEEVENMHSGDIKLIEKACYPKKWDEIKGISNG